MAARRLVNALYIGAGFALVGYAGVVLKVEDPWATIVLGAAAVLLIGWVRTRQGPSRRPDVLFVGGCVVLAAYGVVWQHGGRAVLGYLAAAGGLMGVLLVLKTQTTAMRKPRRPRGAVYGRYNAARGRYVAMRDNAYRNRSGPLVISPELNKIVEEGKRAVRVRDWFGVQQAVNKLLRGRTGLSTSDDIPVALVYAFEFLTARDMPLERDVVEALGDEAVRWLHHRDEPMIPLQKLRSDLQLRKYRDTRDPVYLRRSISMFSDAVDRMAPPR